MRPLLNIAELRSAIPRLGSLFAPRRGEPACLGLGLGHPVAHRFVDAETTGPPRFLGIPRARMPRSRTPVESRCQALSDTSMLPSAVVTASASTPSNFRGSITQPARSLCTLRGAGYPLTTQHSVPAGGQPLPGGAVYPPGCSEDFRACHLSTSLPSSPGFAWRNTTSGYISFSDGRW